MSPRWIAIVDVDRCDARGVSPVGAVEAAFCGGAPAVLVRARRQPACRLARVVSDALERVPASSLIVSDRADVCVAYGLGGVQLPASGLPVAVARAACGPLPWIGASVHDIDELDASGRASGLLVSPIWATASKPGHPGIGLAGLAALAGRTAVPVYALGGVTPDRVSEVVDHGAYGCAALSPFCDRATAVESAARAFARAFERA